MNAGTEMLELMRRSENAGVQAVIDSLTEMGVLGYDPENGWWRINVDRGTRISVTALDMLVRRRLG